MTTITLSPEALRIGSAIMLLSLTFFGYQLGRLLEATAALKAVRRMKQARNASKAV